MITYLEFTADKKPFQIAQLLLENSDFKADLVHQDYKTAGAGVEEKEIAILVFEKLFLRNGSTGSLTVTVDNFSGTTEVKSISSGTSQGLLELDWGAGKSFIKRIKTQLKPHIVQITKEVTK